VDLEVIVRVNFEEKVDGRYVMQTKLENELRPKIHMYVWPINWSWAQITGKCKGFANELSECMV